MRLLCSKTSPEAIAANCCAAVRKLGYSLLSVVDAAMAKRCTKGAQWATLVARGTACPASSAAASQVNPDKLRDEFATVASSEAKAERNVAEAIVFCFGRKRNEDFWAQTTNTQNSFTDMKVNRYLKTFGMGSLRANPVIVSPSSKE